MLIGVGQIGCSPNALAQNSADGTTCVDRINVACQLFNNKLKSLVDQLNNNLADGRFIYVDAYGIFQDLINRPASFGTPSSIALDYLIVRLENLFDVGFHGKSTGTIICSSKFNTFFPLIFCAKFQVLASRMPGVAVLGGTTAKSRAFPFRPHAKIEMGIYSGTRTTRRRLPT